MKKKEEKIDQQIQILESILQRELTEEEISIFKIAYGKGCISGYEEGSEDTRKIFTK